MGEQLSGSSVVLTLLVNTIATGAVLVALILTFAPISGAHLNPVVTCCRFGLGDLSGREALLYICAQFIGAGLGVVVAHAMFGQPWLQSSTHVRSGPAQWLSEVIATFGLLTVISGVSRSWSNAAAFAVGAYITAAYWFTASTSFANPAVTVARAFTSTFSGIRLGDVPAFIGAQFVGGIGATMLFRWIHSPRQKP
jgi:glycerol uptake facilitator-like aquaporin